MHRFKIVTPHAGVIIWNYNNRVAATEDHGDVNEIDEIIINTSSLMGISTKKSKGAPAGSFEFRLAPTTNWIARITPGSWCVLNMSQDKPLPVLSKDNVGYADPDFTKMLGRIDSVRLVIEVDQETGTRRSSYVVTGQDWCSVFDTKLYVDPIVRNNNLEKLGAIGHASRLLFDDMVLGWTNDQNQPLPTSSQVVSALIQLWGAPLLDIAQSFGPVANVGSGGLPINSNPIFSSEAQFKLPVKVAQYMNFGGSVGKLIGSVGTSVNFAKLITRYDGKLTGYDTYSDDNKEALGFPSPDSFYKVNSFWQMLTDNANTVVNELVTDMHWSEDGTPSLALYKRSKPFLNRSVFEGHNIAEVQTSASKFSDVRCTLLPLEDVVNVSVGTNWRDKVNFIEIRPQPQLNTTNFENAVKLDCQIIDRPAYERDGFKPMIQSVFYMPFNGGQPAPLRCLNWKYLMKEWYFNTHLMLNGSATIIGQNRYIQVGDNIQIDSAVLGSGDYNASQGNKQTYLLAHVESISHTFTVNPESGARSFSTTIQFVRGVFTDKERNILGNNEIEGAIDNSADDLPGFKEKNIRSISTSTPTDPDSRKEKGN